MLICYRTQPTNHLLDSAHNFLRDFLLLFLYFENAIVYNLVFINFSHLCYLKGDFSFEETLAVTESQPYAAQKWALHLADMMFYLKADKLNEYIDTKAGDVKYQLTKTLSMKRSYTIQSYSVILLDSNLN